MTTLNESDFGVDLHQRILFEADRNETSQAEAFTAYMISVLTDAAELDDGDVAMYTARGMAASGFSIADDGLVVDVLSTDYMWSDEPRSMGKTDLTNAFARLSKFVERCSENRLPEMEESTPAWDMATRLAESLDGAQKIRLTLITNARVKGALPEIASIGGAKVSLHVWDVERLFQLESSGQEREPIVVDLQQMAGAPIAVLGPQGVPGDYEAYLMLIPGDVLAAIYETYGARLLELNVRSFLQARGKVNRGIQQTIKDEAHRFLAYNNGISMTASRVDLVTSPNGSQGIKTLYDLQIVNGGQTTASLSYAVAKAKKDESPLEGIYVQAKLSVVPHEHLMAIVPRISEYSNSQNTVRMADFSANDAFHVELEKLSRTIWAPAADGSQRLTRWFYERARGQYADAVASERTPARQREFKAIHPLGQKFTKTDVAKYELTWSQRPDLVSLGAEKSFREFMLLLEDRDFTPDNRYFESLVAKAIVFRRAEKLIGALGLGGYRAQAVTYTLALISKRTAQQLDLGRVWRRQDIPDSLAAAIESLGARVHARLLQSAGSSNISEWAKKKAAWDAIQKIDWSPDGMELLASESDSGLTLHEVWTEEAKAAAVDVMKISSGGWDALQKWGARTKSLDTDERKLAGRLRSLMLRNDVPSPKECVQGQKIIQRAEEFGFSEF